MRSIDDIAADWIATTGTVSEMTTWALQQSLVELLEDVRADRSLVTTVEDVASALQSMGSEEQWNLGTPQAVRDLCRHQAARLRSALHKGEDK